MNERIKKLAELAGMRVVQYEHDEDTYFTESIDLEKFAELIVRECALIAGLMEHEGRSNIGANILDSFGVDL